MTGMARWTQTWLQDLGTSAARSEGDHRGARFGLPASGPGSVASWGTRFAAFMVDVLGSAAVGRLIDPLPDLEKVDASASFAPLGVLVVINVLGLALVGQTPGMRLFKIRVLPLKGAFRERLGLVPALLRTVLLSVLLPALI
ncbi:MAG: domain containing protein, partial [Frankiales bacterium]|nr:domain containing protein [Frankiales bacterium]